MSTYKLIIKKILKTDNNVFLYNYIDDGIDNIVKTFFDLLLNKEINIKNKFDFFKESLENFFIKNNNEESFIRYFCKIQKTYHILNRFVYHYKYKKAKIVVNADMCLNELSINDKNVICIFHNNSKYLFCINDLIKIINCALTNSHMHFSEPKCIKNPYDNIPFLKSTLYNIYFYIRYKTDYYPELFFKFFNVDFNLTTFKINNEYVLREYSIKHFVENSPSNILIDEIKCMIDFYNESCKKLFLPHKIIIHEEFPKDKLIKIMKPYLLLFMRSQYSYLAHKRRETSYILQQKFIMFHKFNPQFGRKKYKTVTKYDDEFKRVKTNKVIEFNDKHIHFNNVKKQNSEYLTDHLKYNDAIFINERVLVRRSFTFNFVNNINFNDDEGDDYNEEDEEEHDEEDEQEDEQEDEEEHDEEDEQEDEEDDEEHDEEHEQQHHIIENNAITLEQLEDYYDNSDIDSTS